MRIAVVILNWNGVKLLEQFLPSILSFSAGAEIYVADNASTDDSVSFIKSNFPSVKIIQNSDNFGFAKGYNEALKQINADVYALVNSDIEVTENWLRPIIDEFENNLQTAIIQPKIRDYKNKQKFEYAGAAGGFIDKYGFPFCRGRIFDTIETDSGQYDDDCDIFWASGACFFIRAEVFKQLNGFDDEFFAHQEEIDLCWRAFNSGYSVRYLAGSVVYHVGGATLQQGNPHKTYLNFRNSLLMLQKNVPAASLYGILLSRLIFDGIAGARFLIQGLPRHTLAIIRAHFSFYKMMNANALKRVPYQKRHYFKVGSIIRAYYINGHKTYSELF